MYNKALGITILCAFVAISGCDSDPEGDVVDDYTANQADQASNEEAVAVLGQKIALSKSGHIDKHYIIVFKEGVIDAPGKSKKLAAKHGSEPTFTYKHAIKGFAAHLSEEAANALASDPDVAWVEQDGVVQITGSGTQASPTWGIDRIDQRDLPRDNSYHYDYDGTGIHAYVIDTGLRYTHSNFGGRATFDANFGDGNNDPNGDCHGHGTHVGGTIASSTYGVAKNAHVHGIRVLNCNGSGSWSSVIAGIDWVRQYGQRPAVANMSLGGGFSSSINAATANLADSGIPIVVAAGNSNANACNASPAAEPKAITVGSTTSSDARSSFSNYGTCVDIFAPGSSITSTYKNSDTSTATMSGTSMASPHVAGAAALVLDQYPSLTSAQVADTLTARATAGKVSNPGAGSPNLLLYSLGGSGTPPAPLPLPGAPSLVSPANAATGVALRPAFDWDAASGTVDSYRIDVSTDGFSTFVVSESSISGGTTNFTPTFDLGASTNHSWRVRARNASGPGAWSTPRTFTTITPVADIPIHGKVESVTANYGRKSSTASASAAAHNSAGDGAVSGATVVGEFSAKGTVRKIVSGQTDGSGLVSFSSGAMKGVKSSDTITFCITDVSGSGFTYDGGANHPTCSNVGDGGGGDPPPPPPPPPSEFTLTTTKNKSAGTATLNWSGGTGPLFDVKRDGGTIALGASGSSYVDSSPHKGKNKYQVCEASTSTCTNTSTVKF